MLTLRWFIFLSTNVCSCPFLIYFLIALYIFYQVKYDMNFKQYINSFIFFQNSELYLWNKKTLKLWTFYCNSFKLIFGCDTLAMTTIFMTIVWYRSIMVSLKYKNSYRIFLNLLALFKYFKHGSIFSWKPNIWCCILCLVNLQVVYKKNCIYYIGQPLPHKKTAAIKKTIYHNNSFSFEPFEPCHPKI